MTRYSFGGDEHIFVEIDEEMSLDAFFKSLSITKAVREAQIRGVTEICPANASFQVRFDPDVIAPDAMLAELKALESAAESAPQRLTTRIIEVPVFYRDPWTHETLMRFRERHQDPSGTDLDYAARVNGLPTPMPSSKGIIPRPGSSRWSDSSPGCPSSISWSNANVSSRCRNTCARAPTRQSRPWAMAAASAASIPCAGRADTRCSASRRCRSTTRRRTVSYLRDFMVLFQPGRHRPKWRPIGRELSTTTSPPRSRPGAGRTAAWRRCGRSPSISPNGEQGHRRRPTRRLEGGAEWPLRSLQARACRPPSRTWGGPGYYHLGIPHGRRDGPARRCVCGQSAGRQCRGGGGARRRCSWARSWSSPPRTPWSP
ncbi:MAG: hypothetical protein KatS3mg118_0173 [Paracoccaceae bacterium]|nr:MAG: hypothetical protein KatS3mg118_0173 [Paracoccaceae bacterium]